MSHENLTVSDFLKGIQNMNDTCLSCKFFNTSTNLCKIHNTQVESSDPKCGNWRYAM